MYRYFRPLIDGGFVYIAQPPLYKIKIGKEVHYAYTDEEKNAIVPQNAEEVLDVENDGSVVDEEVIEESEEETKNTKSKKGADKDTQKEDTKKSAKVSIQRYKGLGEMNAEELWETTMDPARRVLKQVTVGDGVSADKVFDILMGSDVPSRKSFIQSNAKTATLDI
jgi:DNA gyrase subunit B